VTLRLLSAAAFGLGLATLGAVPSAAHNGYGIAPIFSEPFGLIVTDGEAPLVVRWTAREFHLDQFYRYKVQSPDFPPTPSPPTAMRSGELLTTLVSDALSYEVSLDLSSLATGAWRVFAEFDEPPFCVELEQVPALVVVRKADDPAPFGVLMTSPLADSPIVDTSTELVVEAISPSATTLKIEAGEIIRDPDFPDLALCVEFTWTPLFTIAESLPMVADPDAGPDRWRMAMTWDTSAVPDGAYLLRVTATNASGDTQVHWGRRWVNVERPFVAEPTEPGPEANPETSPESGPDNNPESAESTEPPSDDGCQSGPSPFALFGLLAALASRRLRPA